MAHIRVRVLATGLDCMGQLWIRRLPGKLLLLRGRAGRSSSRVVVRIAHQGLQSWLDRRNSVLGLRDIGLCSLQQEWLACLGPLTKGRGSSGCAQLLAGARSEALVAVHCMVCVQRLSEADRAWAAKTHCLLQPGLPLRS